MHVYISNKSVCGTRLPGTGVPDTCERHVGAGSQEQILGKSSHSS